MKGFLYPIIGCVVSAVCLIGIVVFILSRHKCRKRTPKDTESEILKQKHNQDKKNAASTSLAFYNLEEKPIYTSITQQEDNEIAEEVRESYKNISQNVDRPIVCCPNDKSSYSYFPRLYAQDQEVNNGKVAENKLQEPVDNLEIDFDNDSLASQPITNIEEQSSRQGCRETNEADHSEMMSEKRSEDTIARDIHREITSESSITDWINSDANSKPSSFDDRKPNNNDNNKNFHSLIEQHNVSSKTNFDMNFEEVESILTSVSRMDRKRLEKLKNTEFYKDLKYDRKSLNLSLDNINNESTIDESDITSPSSVVEKQKKLILYKENKETVLDSSDTEEDELLSEWKNISKRSLKKPTQYIDRDSESFFKTVQHKLNPDEFSETERTCSEQFKQFKERFDDGARFSESALSSNTYSYDKESRFIIIDEKKNQSPKNQNDLLSDISSSASTNVNSSTHRGNPLGSSLMNTNDIEEDTLDNLEQFEDLVANLSYDDDASIFSFQTNFTKTTRESKPKSSPMSSTTVSKVMQEEAVDTNTRRKGPRIFISEQPSYKAFPNINRISKPFNDHNTSYTSSSSSNLSSSRSETNVEKILHRTPTKFKSTRGNLSTYISSRQSATATKIQQNELSKSLSTTSIPAIKPRGKIGQSPARRMFQSRYLTKQNGGKRLKHSSSLNGTF